MILANLLRVPYLRAMYRARHVRPLSLSR